MPSEKQALEALEKDTVDTSTWTVDDPREAKNAMDRAESKVRSVAVPQPDGTLRGWHVTDDPEKVVKLLKTQGDFYAREGDLCGGLYVSAVPHYWEGRSQKKWDFLPKMAKEARARLYDAVHERLREEVSSGYITRSEYKRAFDDIAMAKEKDFWQILDIVANQPFNVDIIGISERLGLAMAFKPPHIPVDFTGRYLEFNTERAIQANEALLLLKHGSLDGLSRLDLCNMLKGYGWDGVYTKAGMGTNPELVIWSGDKIIAFGDWSRDFGAQMSGPSKPISIHGERFDASISPNRMRADIVDKVVKLYEHERIRKGSRVEDEIVEVRGRLSNLSLQDIGEIGVIADAGMQGASWGSVPSIRFRPRGHKDRDGVDIVDPKNLTKIVQLDEKALKELMGLAVQMMGSMTGEGPRGLIP